MNGPRIWLIYFLSGKTNQKTTAGGNKCQPGENMKNSYLISHKKFDLFPGKKTCGYVL